MPGSDGSAGHPAGEVLVTDGGRGGGPTRKNSENLAPMWEEGWGESGGRSSQARGRAGQAGRRILLRAPRRKMEGPNSRTVDTTTQ